MTRTALVTGASSGIGEALAEVFAAEGCDLVITARREDRLLALSERLTRQHGVRVHVIACDLAEAGAASRLAADLVSRGIIVDTLVNNAGFGVPGSYRQSPWERQDALLQVMVVTVAELTHRLLPGMLERGYGRILNVASLAGLVPPTAGHTLYGASKAFVVRFSQALAQEVAHKGVHVTALCPGFTYSAFHDITGTRAMVSRLPRFLWMTAPEVARQGYEAVMSGKPVHITGRVNRIIAGLVRVTPQWLVDVIHRRVARSYRKT